MIVLTYEQHFSPSLYWDFQILDFLKYFLDVIQMTKNILIMEIDRMSIKKKIYFYKRY